MRSPFRAVGRSVLLFAAIGLTVLGLTATLPAAEHSTAGPREAATPQIYVKQTTWPDTMLASRAALRRLVEGDSKAAARRFVTEPVLGDGPGQHVSVNVAGCRLMRLVGTLEQGGGNCHIWGDARLIAKDGTVTWLSNLQPALVQVGWGQLHRDLNWQSNPLKIGTRQFDRGIWVHANSDVCYALGGKYERFEAWVGMDAARPIGVARFKVLLDEPDLTPGLWQRLAADFPQETKWFTEDALLTGRTWFQQTTTVQAEQDGFLRAISPLGPTAVPLRKQWDELRRAKVSADDRRWLELYLRATRCRDCCQPLERVWIVEVRRALQSSVEELASAGVPGDDPRWGQAKARIAQLGEAIEPASGTIELASLRASLDNLRQALPGRLPSDAELIARLTDIDRRWQQASPAVQRGAEEALQQLPGLMHDVAQFRQSLLLSLTGMKEFFAAPAHRAMKQEWESQFAALEYDLGRRAHFAQYEKEVYRPEALILDADRDPADVVLRRTAALLKDLTQRTLSPGTDRRLVERGPSAGRSDPALIRLEKELTALQAANASVDLKNREARFVLFADACRVRRLIALHNPLLNFEQLVFIKHHRALFNHMCDQYYGMAIAPGGGLYVLEHPFGTDPQVRDVLADAVVERGRLKGQKLSGGPTTPPAARFDGMGNRLGAEDQGGSFLSPSLSPDGRTIAFAYVECTGDREHRHHTDPTQGHWHEGRCFHIFQVRVDGTHLQQLTDGTWNDFDPCWLPNGRIAMISERRGGYLRCGRVCPNYTLFDMAADGSDINCLSFHETNEWQPSVTHDGRILYTRWDYVDRFGCTAHLPWITTLDGRDSRAVHGNFAPRQGRPDMELDCRVIPASPKIVATAAPHHGQAYGSLVVIDPRVPDDDGMGPVRRLTPEVGFPESQGGAQVYGTAWPLSEDYFLCVYDAAMQTGGGLHGQPLTRGNYGIYLVDSFGNKELIYRDPEIACLSPIPLRAQPLSSPAPDVAQRSPDTNPAARHQPAGEPAEGTVAVINVYSSLKPWPEGTHIKELRVLQLVPMSVPSGHPPHDTGMRIAGARDSVVTVRHVLGTVPVETDGSVHFIVPANKEMFFQALDDRGLAVQSMRSATYLHAGEHLMCQGCHEPKHRAPHPAASTPLALLRAPSRLTPDVEGSNPFSYPRLVQPVLDKHCVQCHAQHADKAPNLAREPIVRHWYASYNSLVQRYAFWDYGDGYRTTPGRFGARASKLYELLQKGHYEVKLSDEELHRLTLWLDCSSMFYGVYEQEGGEAQLRGEIARPTLE